ncbi:hypothetical protein Tco_1457830 [Tanacetum coccineum]
MASESSSQQQPKLTLSSNVHFECEDGHIAFNNSIALLESKIPLYNDMLQFLSNSCISTALTKQPSAYYSKYLREFWYTAEEMVRVALETLGLVDENNPEISSTDLVDSSPQRIRYFSATWRNLMLYIVKCLGGNQGSHDLVTKLTTRNKGRDQNICYTREVECCTLLLIVPCPGPLCSMEQVIDTQPAEETVATADTTLSLDASESAEEQGNQLKHVDAEKVQETIVEEEVKESGIKSLGDVPLDEFCGADANSDADEILFCWFGCTPRVFLSSVGCTPRVFLVPRLVVDAFEERVSELLFDTLKNIHPQIIKDSVKQALPNFDKRVKLTLNAKIPELLIKPLNNAFNLLNKKERISVRKEVTIIRELLKYRVTQLDKNDVNLHKLVDLIRDLVVLIDSALDFAKAALEGEKKSTQENIESGGQSSKQAPPVSTTLVVHSSKEKGSEEKPTKDEPPFKKLRILVPNPKIPSSTPLKSLIPQGIRPPIVINMPLDQFTNSLFNTTSSEFSPTPFKDDKGKGVASEEGPLKKLILLIDEGGSAPKLLNLKQFSLFGKKMTLEETKAHMEAIKRLEFLKTEKEKSEKRLKVLTPKELEAHAAELTAYEAKRSKILQEYNHCITFRANPLPITKIGYKVNNSTKEASMRITRYNLPLNLTVRSKSNGLLLKNLKAKFQWVKTQAAKLGIPSPPQLTVFELPPAKRKVGIKRKRRYELIHEVFVKENIIVDGMQRNLTLLKGVVRKAGMVIKEPEAGIFLCNGNFNLHVYDELIYEIKSWPDFVQAREIVEKNLDVKDIVKEVRDYLKTYSSAGMDISDTLLKPGVILKNPLLKEHVIKTVMKEGWNPKDRCRRKTCKIDTYHWMLIGWTHESIRTTQQSKIDSSRNNSILSNLKIIVKARVFNPVS